jgi:hypothetical protein
LLGNIDLSTTSNTSLLNSIRLTSTSTTSISTSGTIFGLAIMSAQPLLRTTSIANITNNIRFLGSALIAGTLSGNIGSFNTFSGSANTSTTITPGLLKSISLLASQADIRYSTSGSILTGAFFYSNPKLSLKTIAILLPEWVPSSTTIGSKQHANNVFEYKYIPAHFKSDTTNKHTLLFTGKWLNDSLVPVPLNNTFVSILNNTFKSIDVQ